MSSPTFAAFGQTRMWHSVRRLSSFADPAATASSQVPLFSLLVEPFAVDVSTDLRMVSVDGWTTYGLHMHAEHVDNGSSMTLVYPQIQLPQDQLDHSPPPGHQRLLRCAGQYAPDASVVAQVYTKPDLRTLPAERHVITGYRHGLEPRAARVILTSERRSP